MNKKYLTEKNLFFFKFLLLFFSLAFYYILPLLYCNVTIFFIMMPVIIVSKQ